MQTGACQRLKGVATGESTLNGCGVLLGSDRSVLELDRGELCTT